MSIVKIEDSDAKQDYTAHIVTNQFIFRDDGFLQHPLQESLTASFSQLENYAAQGSLRFSTACSVGKMLDHMLLAVKRPTRWRPMHAKFITDSETDGDILLAKDRIDYLSRKCCQMNELCVLRLLTMEALDGFISVIEPILLEAAESKSPGVIGHGGPPDSATVSLLSSDQRAKLITAFKQVTGSFRQNTLSIGTLLELCETIDGMLQSLGRAPEYIVSGDTVPNKDAPFNFERAIWLESSLFQAEQAIRILSLRLGSLSGFIKLVNIIVIE